MRILFAIIFLFSLEEINGQTVKLNTLINGEVIHSSTILDSNEEIFGYFYLYDQGKVDKNVFSYRYVVLDINLNKVIDGEFIEKKYSSFMMGTLNLGIRVKYLKDKIWIRIFEFDINGKYFERSRYIDLKTNKISPNYQFRDDSLLVNEEIARENLRIEPNRIILPANGIGFYNDVNIEIDKYKSYFYFPKTKKKRKISMFDENFKLKWEHSLDKKGQFNLEEKYSDSTILLFLATNFENTNNKSLYYSVKALDAQTGVEKFDVIISGKEKFHKIIKSYKVIDKKLIVYGLYGKELLHYALNQDEALGLFKMEMDLNNGKILSEYMLNWKDLGDYLKTPKNNFGKIEKGNFYPFVHEFSILNNGQSICVIEYFKPNKLVDIVFLELDENLKPKIHKRIEKGNHTMNTFVGQYIKDNNDFDYKFSQNLSNINEFIFFFETNENYKRFSNRKDHYFYNIITYIDGKFEHQKIELTTEESYIQPMLAKRGYMLLLEKFADKKKSAELRLERVNL